MAEMLSKQSIILVNYPEDVRLPGDEPSTGRSKGISDLSTAEQARFAEAFQDETVLIHFEVKPEQRHGTLFLLDSPYIDCSMIYVKIYSRTRSQYSLVFRHQWILSTRMDEGSLQMATAIGTA
jgi:hypothetical protein